MDGIGPTQRTPAQRRALRDTLERLRSATQSWRKEIFDQKLDPYLARGRKFMPYVYLATKGGDHRLYATWIDLVRDLNMERWGGPADRDEMKNDALEGFLERHPYDEQLRLQLTTLDPGLAIRTEAGLTPCPETATVGICDMLATSEKDVRVRVKRYGAGEDESLEATLPAGAELAYGDLLVLVDRANPGLEDRLSKSEAFRSYTDRAYRWGPDEPNPLHLPATRRLLGELEKKAAEEGASYEERQRPRQARGWLVDFWTF